MSSNQSSELWNEGLKLVSYCPVCETRYNPMEAKVLGENGETHLLHVQCRKCSHSILALVLVNQAGASSVGLLTDLSFDDVMLFRENQKVSIDDVIDIHAKLDEGGLDHIFDTRRIEQVKRRVRKRTKKETK
ncbi:hypothetical protein HOI18_04405 [Candidatus Uhrbacteria bacterium]|jgi:hypothetical protein|nr:hypothetical protein [Candidatus Uhrbacteria bacterium]